MNLFIIGAISLAIGIFLGYLARKFILKNKVDNAEAKVSKSLEDAKNKSKEILYEAKDKAVKILEETKKEEFKRREEIRKMENRLEQKEKQLDNRYNKVGKKERELQHKASEIKNIRQEVLQIKDQQKEKLEKISNLTKEEAKKILLGLIEKENSDELAKAVAKIEKEKKEELENKAKDVMTMAMQRYAGSHAAETTAATVTIPSDEIKGRIIGREGRNIKALEKLTGAEIIVDDTPEAIVISSFDPLRREVTKQSLEYLIEDGRIHPTKIEESVEKAKEQVNDKIREAGEAAVNDVGIASIDPKLAHILGRLRYRTSYGQNVLLHSLEVAHLSGAIAAELGLDVVMAKKAGLFHDIGKAVDQEVQGTHVEIGVNILNKFNQPKEIIDAVKSHHEDYPFQSALSFVVAAADALSASRPGARKDTLEKYLKRLEDLENLVNSFGEVEKCFAIQAGREIRVFVDPEKIDDLATIKLAKKIAKTIEKELNYPGEIKVNLLRETKSVEYAR